MMQHAALASLAAAGCAGSQLQLLEAQLLWCCQRGVGVAGQVAYAGSGLAWGLVRVRGVWFLQLCVAGVGRCCSTLNCSCQEQCALICHDVSVIVACCCMQRHDAAWSALQLSWGFFPYSRAGKEGRCGLRDGWEGVLRIDCAVWFILRWYLWWGVKQGVLHVGCAVCFILGWCP